LCRRDEGGRRFIALVEVSRMKPLQKRPVLNLPLSSLDGFVEFASVAALLFLLVSTALYWSALPERVPTHFGLSGRPDAWGAKSSLLLLPIFAIVLYAGMTILGRFPHIYNYPVQLTEENVERQYRIARTLIGWVKLEVVWTFALIQWETMRVVFGKAEGLDLWLIIGIVTAPLVTAGVGIYKAYRAR